MFILYMYNSSNNIDVEKWKNREPECKRVS